MEKIYFYIDTSDMTNISYCSVKYTMVKTPIFDTFFTHLKLLSRNFKYEISQLRDHEIEKRIVCAYKLILIKKSLYIIYLNNKLYYINIDHKNKTVLLLPDLISKSYNQELDKIKILERKRKIENT